MHGGRLEAGTKDADFILVLATLKHFGCDMDKVTVDIRENSTHCDYKYIADDDGNYLFADMIYSFIERVMKGL